MLRASRRAVAERCSALSQFSVYQTQNHSNSVVLRHLEARCCPIWGVSHGVHIGKARNRLYSTPVSARDDSVTVEAKEDAVAVASTNSIRKSRIELRPAPRPTQNISSEASTHTRILPPDSDSHTKPAPTSKPEKSIAPTSFIETIQEDFASAERLGIITPPPEDASRLKKFWHRGKELVKFYFRGAKLIVTNAKTARALKQRLRRGGQPLTRAEWQLTRTSVDDIKRLAPFVLVLLLLEEALPLLVIYVPSLLPSTCVLPSQRHRMAIKRARRQLEALEEGRDSLRTSARDPAPTIQTLDAKSLSTLCGLFALPRFGPNILRRRRLQSHLQYIAEDDKLLAEEMITSQSLAHMGEEQLWQAVSERGIVPTGMTTLHLREKLETWVVRTTNASPLSVVIREATIVRLADLH